MKVLEEELSVKAVKAKQEYLLKLGAAAKARLSRSLLLVGMAGLVGSGKSTVAVYLAKLIGATIVSGDAIRVELRKQGEAYKYVRPIAANVISELFDHNTNVIMDADWADDKRNQIGQLRALVEGRRGKLIILRVVCDPDVMIGRIITASYRNRQNDFFGGAKTNWQGGTEQERGAQIKLRELWRRTPHHYHWSPEGGGQWQLKAMPFAIFANINTDNEEIWRLQLEETAEKLRRI